MSLKCTIPESYVHTKRSPKLAEFCAHCPSPFTKTAVFSSRPCTCARPKRRNNREGGRKEEGILDVRIAAPTYTRCRSGRTDNRRLCESASWRLPNENTALVDLANNRYESVRARNPSKKRPAGRLHGCANAGYFAFSLSLPASRWGLACSVGFEEEASFCAAKLLPSYT